VFPKLKEFTKGCKFVTHTGCEEEQDRELVESGLLKNTGTNAFLLGGDYGERTSSFKAKAKTKDLMSEHVQRQP